MVVAAATLPCFLWQSRHLVAIGNVPTLRIASSVMTQPHSSHVDDGPIERVNTLFMVFSVSGVSSAALDSPPSFSPPLASAISECSSFVSFFFL
jgi:hypothetical protein